MEELLEGDSETTRGVAPTFQGTRPRSKNTSQMSHLNRSQQRLGWFITELQ